MDSPGSLERDVSPTHAPVDRDCSAAIPSSEEAHRHTPGTWICTNQNPASSPRGAHGAEHFSQRKRDHFSPPYILQGGRETQPCCGIAAGDQEDGDGLTPRHCSSFRHTELSFPHFTGPDSEKERSHHSGDHSSQNEEEGPCSCSSALESLKGFTWGWGCQRRPAATFKYYFGELKCGLAVPMSQLPATMTCAIVANVPVGAALNGAWITGLISAVFGGSPLSITTVTSSLAVTLAKVTRTTCDESTNVCHEEGLEFIFPALILSGLCCLLLGLLRLSRFSQFVPSATIVGYLNAVAILNVRAQVETFRFDPVTSTGYEWLWVLFMIIVVFGVMFSWEKIPHIRLNRLIPSSVFAIGLSSFIEFVLVRRVCSMQTKTVASLSAKGGDDLWPKPFFLKQENIKPLAFYMQPSNLVTTLELTLALVMVNYISTLITVDMMSDKAGNMPTQPDQHLVSVGAANTVACFLGALPGSTAPSPSLLNLKVGGKGRESAVCCALVNLALVGASTYLLDYVPLGGLAGIIMYTAYHAFQWRAVAAMFASFLPARLRGKHPILQRKICRSDAFVMLLTTVIAVFADIGSAILSGVCISACVFAWKNRSRLTITSRIDTESGIKYYRVKGPIFFLTKRKLLKSFDIDQDPSSVVFELTGDACQLFDFGAMETLNTIVARYRKKNKHVRVVGMQRGDRKMIIKAGRMCEFARIHIVEKTMDDGDGPSPIPPITDMMKLPC
ncbi:inorganic anion transporter, sulfate permease (SulP) family protein [Besnoitia besnoiti]|uniref:Inorganic anion transporter, sulfate permease (SulP) family protein n=1 Tax=Besnoitia besnoiti TaxID=94643 RepID=A0A2A9MFT8_BESBE|nr:inorganic anion transporter, sulfate permease (SulP) family protein [Besnoitia besnoiti]PFH36054.1 inorganic anion transporter, sulfate permease (SulP) family protein [Besnoitia besnoiti]